MSHDTLRARLEALNRGPLPSPPRERPPANPPVRPVAENVLVAALRTLRPNSGEQPSQLKQQPPNGSAPIAGLLRSGSCVETPFGQHWQITVPIDRLWQDGAKLVAARQEFLRRQLAAATTAVEPSLVLHPEFAAFINALPDRALALDLETCGLAGSALFLSGLLRNIDGCPTVELLFARSYAEEAAVLWSLWQIVANHDVLLTFNGKSFDWPMVVERSVRHRLPIPDVGWAQPTSTWNTESQLVGGAQPAKMHVDILHHSRRRYKGRLPNCRLQTLELHVCRRTRADDIPGHAIPSVYADYVRTGFEREIDVVLYHNALDLVTLFDLAHRLAC